jgi:hypothetical protein
MATTPEEFFMEGLTNLSPPSPSVLLDLPPMPNDAGQDSLCPDEIVLSYVSCVLMEDHTEDKLLCQDADHPAVLQVQKAFAQILSSPSFSTNSNNTVNRDNVEGARNLFQDCNGDQCTLRSSLPIGALAAGSVLKGMEEATRFLPEDNGFRMDQQVNQMTRESGNCRVFKKRYSRDEDGEVGRAVFMMMEELEEMFDKMMLRGYETCIEGMKKLRITKADEAKNNKKGYSKGRSNVVDLYTLLINCAQAVSASNFRTAHELLKQIKQHASATGDATQRLAQCFAKGLEAWLMGTGSQLWQLLTLEQPLAIEYLKAYNLYMATCSFNRVALFFNIMTIGHAMVGKSKLHIVDYGPHHGF